MNRLLPFLFSPGSKALCQGLLTLAIRLAFGWQLFLTGQGKLLNLQRTADYFDSLNLPVPTVFAFCIGCTEAIGGIFVGLGLGARPAALALTGSMAGALMTAHRADVAQGLDGLFAAAPFPYLLAMLVVLAHGAGLFSLDARIGGRFAEKKEA